MLTANNDVIDKFLYRCVATAGEVKVAVDNVDRYVSILPGHLGIIPNCADINWESPELLAFIQSQRITIINEPFPFKMPNEDIYSFRKQYMLPSNSVVEIEKNIKQKNIPVIGIHIRQTDYKTWRGGKYYKDNEFYNNVISGIMENLGIDCQYFIAHDGEFVLSDQLINQVNIKVSDGRDDDAASDFLNFSVCNYLLGPLSTFTRQAINLGRLWFSKSNKFMVIEPGENAKDIVNKFVVEVRLQEKMLCR